MVVSEKGIRESFAKIKYELMKISAQTLQISSRQLDILQRLQKLESMKTVHSKKRGKK